MYTVLAAQQHRRFMKSHMPLSELPSDPRITYIVVTPLSYFDKLLKSLSVAWERRAEPNVVLMHYEDLSAELAS
jgi:hypothetical protein